VGTTTTDANGDYSFTGIPDGTYTVDVTDDANVLEGYWHSLSDQDQTADGTSKADTYSVTVATSTLSTIDFGYYNKLASISDLVWNDLNADGDQDGGGEVGMAGVTVTLTTTYPNAAVTVLTTTTDVNGNYRFDGLLGDENYDGVGTAGTGGVEPEYKLSIAVPTSYLASPANQGGDPALDSETAAGTAVTATLGTTITTYDFGVYPTLGNIEGYVYDDTNSNGSYDAGEGTPSVDVFITPSGGGTTITVTTDANGFFEKTGLDPDDYDVNVDDTDLAAGLTQTVGTDPTEDITVTAGGTATDNNGYFPASALDMVKTTTNGTVFTIGNTVNYRVAVEIPDAVTINSVTIVDTLPDEFVYANGTLAIPTVTDVEWDGTPVTSASYVTGTRVLTIPFGEIKNTSGADADIVITYSVTVANSSSNDFGQTKTNAVVATGNSGDIVKNASVDVTVVEPQLSVAKSLTNVTNAGVLPDAGDTLRYTVAITNGSTDASIAYDVKITDVLPVGLQYSAMHTATSDLDDGPSSTVGTGAAGSPQTLTWTTNTGAISIAVGATVNLVYDVTVRNDVEPDQVLGNTATVVWTSLSGASTGERDSGGGVDDYTTSDTASTTVLNSYSIAKAHTSDTHGAGDADVRIGDLITYTVTATFQEGTTANVRVTDTLPAGLEFVNTVSIGGDTEATYEGTGNFTYTVSDVPAADATTLIWDFDDVVNAPAAGGDSIAIVYRARVNTNVTDIPLSPTTTTRTNSAQLLYDDAANNAETVNTPTDPAVTVKQPLLTVTKASDPASGTTTVVADDTVTYTVTVSNATGNAAAYDVVIKDTIPVGLRGGTITGVVATSIKINGADKALQQPTVTGTFANDGGIQWNLDTDVADAYTIPAGQSLVLVYTVDVDSDVAGDVVMTNDAYVPAYYSFDDEAIPAGSLVADRRTYPATAHATTTLTTTAATPGNLSKAATATAVIGETITYTIEVPADGGTVDPVLYDVTVTDVLPANVTYVSAVAGTGNAGTGLSASETGGTVTIDFDTIPANSQAVITVTATVDNVAANEIATVLTNSATYVYERTDGGAEDNSGGAAVEASTTVNEPLITITKAAANQTHAAPALTAASDTIEYTITLAASGDANRSDAFDVSVADQLGPYLVYDTTFAPTVTGTGNTIGAAVVTGGDGTPGNEQTLTWNIGSGSGNDGYADIDVPAGTSVTVTYRAKVHASLTKAYAITNDVTGSWSSIDGGLGGNEAGSTTSERTGSGAAQNDYADTDDTLLYTTFGVTKTLVSGDPAAIGDTVSYRLVLAVTQGTTSAVTITDVLPADMGLDAGSVVVTNATGLSTDYVDETNSVDDTSTPGEILFTFGAVVCTNNAPNNTITIDYDVVVENGASNTDAATKTNTATARGTGVPDSTDDADLTIHEPVLTVSKAFENITECGQDTTRKLAAHRPQTNDTLRFTTTVSNTSGTATAYDVDVRDMVDSLVLGNNWFDSSSLDVESATLNGIDQGATYDSPDTTGNVLNWGRGDGDESIDIAPGETFEVVYTLTMETLGDAENVTRNVAVDWTSMNGVEAGERTGTGAGENDYLASYTHTLYSYNPIPTIYTVAAGDTATLDADGNLDLDGAGPGASVALLGGEQITLNDGSRLEVTGDGLPDVIQGNVSIYLTAGAAATIQQTGDFVVEYLTMNGGGTLTIVHPPRARATINYGNLTMGIGDTLIFPDDSEVLFGPASIQGASGASNLATIRPTTEHGGLILIFCCNTDIDYGHFAGIDDGYVEFRGPTTVDHGAFSEGDGTNPYIKYLHPATVVWSDLAFRKEDGATTTIENIQPNADDLYWIEVDGYLGPTEENYIAGNSTDIEPAGTTDNDPASGVRWSNGTPAFGVETACGAPATGGVLVAWSAQVELGVLKYLVQVADGAAWTTVGEILARSEGLSGGSYEFLDRQALPDEPRTYRLLCVDVDGGSRDHAVGQATAVAVAPAAATVRSRVPTFPADGVFSIEELLYNVQSHATETPATLGTARKASAAAGGFYDIGDASHVYNVGRELVDLGGGVVYVRPYSDPYTDANVVWGSDDALQVIGDPGTVPAPDAQGRFGPDGYTAIVHVEQDQTLALNSMLPPGPNWFYGYSNRLAPGNAPILVANVPSPASTGTATVLVAMRSTTDGEHDLGLAVNDVPVARATWRGKGHHMARFEFDLATCPLLDGDNQVQLWTSASGSSKRLDYVEIYTPATPALRAGSLIVDVLAVGNLSIPGAVRAADITEFGNEVALSIGRGAIGGLRAGRRIYVADNVGTLAWSDPKNLTAIDEALAGKQYVAVAPEAWGEALAPLVAKHQDEGISSVAVTAEDVYDTYGSGLPTPAALVCLGQRVQPEYLLIGAGASHDPKGLQGDLPPAGIPTSFIHVREGTASTDDLYTKDLSIAVGRLPAHTAQELTNMVNKIVDFYPGRRAVMMADVDDATMGYGSFAALQAELGQQLPSVLLDANTMNGAAMRAALIGHIRDGANLVTYQGHGNNALIGDSYDILNTTHVDQIPPSAWLLATCLTGVYTLEDNGTKVLASELLRTAGNGAVSVLASTCFGQAGTEHRIVEEAVRRIAAGGATWGEILLQVKATLLPSETAAIYTLLGDPAMHTLNPVPGDREIVIVAPVAGGFVNGDQPAEVRFGLRGEWWRQSLEILWRKDRGEWVPLKEMTIDPAIFDYTIPWDPPPEDGTDYQIMIREISDDSEVR
jgi:fimbrial isopeptide formation D2 family protein/uncharacterized repeat protein (TIGR01451 family)